jgi:hypothetical protein
MFAAITSDHQDLPLLVMNPMSFAMLFLLHSQSLWNEISVVNAALDPLEIESHMDILSPGLLAVLARQWPGMTSHFCKSLTSQ